MIVVEGAVVQRNKTTQVGSINVGMAMMYYIWQTIGLDGDTPATWR